MFVPQAGSARSSTITVSSTSSIFDNINPAMQEVLDRRCAKAAAKGKTAAAKLKLKPIAATARYV